METDMGADVYDSEPRPEMLGQHSCQGLFVGLRSHTEKPRLQTNALSPNETRGDTPREQQLERAIPWLTQKPLRGAQARYAVAYVAEQAQKNCNSFSRGSGRHLIELL